ncbi:hypothetical protein [Paraburkholderia sp. SIMBA_054]|uniref:hypothetical protein n=1 Tax=Paraburkholderia sp. SIMBA_054 TaxID=3085795 RepID=UPI00397AF756
MSSTLLKAPPLGLRPRYIASEERAIEIVAACKRYDDAGKTIPSEWVEELTELNEWLEDHGYAPHEFTPR